MINRIISHYRIIEKLGSGGMGVVYKAQDTRLDRYVAIKVLTDDLAKDPQALARFALEAKAASALNHPNICSIYDIGEFEGHEFIVMELLEGVLLTNCIAGSPVENASILSFGIQIADAMEVAHTAGVIHRDLKPSNIFLTKHRLVKVLDFGLAKITRKIDLNDPDRALRATTVSQGDLTDSGATPGTLAYMSPEQVCGEEVDCRTDLFSFGVVLYEMATGRTPFQRRTPGATFAAIIHESPDPATQLNSRLPKKLDNVLGRALEKDPDRRYQHASEFRKDLLALRRSGKTTLLPTPHPEIATKKAGLVGLRLKAVKRAVSASLFLFVALLIGISAVRYQRSSRALRFRERDSIVLADFTNKTGETVFDNVLKQALGVSLRQSPFLNLLSDSRVAGILKLMTRPPNTPVTGDVAREICQRTGSKAYIGGSISTLGAQYVLELTATACASDDVLAEEQATVERKEQVLGALGTSAARLREKLGESLASLEKFNKPLEEATTPSLEALTQYSMARQLQREQGDPAAIPYVKRALELDPEFAVAYTTLGIFYGNLNRSDLAKENLQKAYDLRDRVTQQERFSIEALYYANVTGEIEKAMQAYHDWARTYPGDYVPRDNLAVCYGMLGQYEKAVPEIEESLRLEPDDAIGYGNLADDYLALNRIEDAKNVLDEASKRGVDTPYMHLTRYRLAFLQNDPPGMKAQASSAVGEPGLEDWQLSEEADTEAYYGRLRKARELTEQAVDSARRNGSVDTAARWEIEEALREAEFGNPVLARKAAVDALALSSNADIELLAALTFARTADNSRASRLVDKVDAELGRDTLVQTYWLPTIRAQIELNNGHGQKAIELLQTAADYDLANPVQSPSHATMYPSYVRGLAYLRVGDGPQAAREFQKIMDHRDMVANSPLGALARLQLGRAYRLSRNAKAGEAYSAFLLAWVNADEDVPVLRQGRAEYAKLS